MCIMKRRCVRGLYRFEEIGTNVRLFDGNLNELAPAILNREAESTLLDVPDALIALEKWPGKIKVIGPVSPEQRMGCADSGQPTGVPEDHTAPRWHEPCQAPWDPS